MKECLLYEKSGDYCACKTCSHSCRIGPFRRGICGVRENNQGKLYSLTYGRLIAENIDPIEKKPLYHYMPGTKTLSIASIGCNFCCAWCQNDDISQMPKVDFDRDAIINKIGVEMEPQQVIDLAKKTNCPSISYTYTEPTIFLEFAFDVMKLAKDNNFKNIWVSNGYFSAETLKLIAPYLDAINIDLKGFNNENYLKYTGAKLQPVLDSIRNVYKKGIHMEVTTLIIPGINDDEKQLTQIVKFLASVSYEIPWHISRFFPAYKMMDKEITPLETLKRAEKLAKKAGLKYVHLGNV